MLATFIRNSCSDWPAFVQCIGPLCYDFSDMEKYFNRAETRKELGVPSDRTCAFADPEVLTIQLRSVAGSAYQHVEGQGKVGWGHRLQRLAIDAIPGIQ